MGSDDPDDPVVSEYPNQVRIDEAFEMTVEQLPKDTPVEITVDWDDGASAAATVKTDSSGQIALSNPDIVGGDLPNDLEVPATVALIQFSSESSWNYQLSGDETLTYSVGTEDEQFASVEVIRTLPDEMAYSEPSHDELVGAVFTPPESEQGPGVLVLHGSTGEPLYDFASQLAQQGFTAFALHYFNGPGRPENLVEVPLEYVETAAQWLLENDRVIGDRVGVIGVSKGGELSLLAGSHIDEIGAVVSVVGSGVVWEGGALLGDFPGTSSWSWNNEPIPYVPYLEDALQRNVSGREFFTESFEAASADVIEEATIPVEEVDGELLLISGGDDKLWPTELFHTISEERLEEYDHPSFTHLVYDDAGHAILPPYRPIRGTTSTEFGGSLAGAAEASHDHWPYVLETLSTLRD